MIQSFTQQLSQLNYGYEHPTIIKNFIVIEGIDGSGSSTQARLLEQYFVKQNIACERSTEPSSGPIGQQIRFLLQKQADSPELMTERHNLPQYFADDRAQHIQVISKQIQNGYICISERYLFSSLVYQGQSTPLAQIWQLNRHFPIPQYFIYMDIPAEKAAQRIAQREAKEHCPTEIFETIGFLTRVHQAYLDVIQHFRQIAPDMQIHCLNADQNRDTIQSKILQYLGR